MTGFRDDVSAKGLGYKFGRISGRGTRASYRVKHEGLGTAGVDENFDTVYESPVSGFQD